MQVQLASAAMMPATSSPSSLASNTHNSNIIISINSSRPLSVKAVPTPLAISSENDPHPSWTFFPPSATYIPHAAYNSNSPVSSPTSTPSHPTSSSHRSSPPVAPAATNINTNNKSNSKANIPTSTPSTHHRILDHCFHLSIETRLKQAEAQYLASTQEQAVEQQIKEQEERHQIPVSALRQDDWRRRQRTLVDEAVVLGRKGSNVEAIVDGILKSHRSSGPLQNLPRHLKHRLHLCQLTSMVFGRFDVASSTNNSAGLNIYSAFHSRRHGASRAAIQHHLTNNPQGQKTRSFFAHPIQSSSYCRRHHRKDCQRTCCTLAKMQQQQQHALEQKKKMTNNYYMNNARKPEQQRVAGLVDAIPAFLKCSAMSYRDIAQCMVEKGDLKDVNDSRVLEGWYRLLLEMMTQAVIESYLCDGTAGVETILDVFSYGDDSDSEEDKSDSCSDEIAAASTTGVEPLQLLDIQGLGARSQQQQRQQQQQQQQQPQPQQQNTVPDATTQDRQDEILFVKTVEYEAFKKAKDDRLEEFLVLHGASMEDHFVSLANKYPLIAFERQMTHYIIRSQRLLEDPKLSRSAEEIGLLIPPATSAYADGSLSMPVSDDEDDEEMEEVIRLEEIKEEDEGTLIPPTVEVYRQQEPSSPEKVQRHEKMKLATITTSMDDEIDVNQRNVNSGAKTNSKTKTKSSNKSKILSSVDSRTHHLPSPPPSGAASRSNTVSPSTSSAALYEEEESIAEAARILTSSSKKHKFAEEQAEAQGEAAAKRIKVEMAYR